MTCTLANAYLQFNLSSTGEWSLVAASASLALTQATVRAMVNGALLDLHDPQLEVLGPTTLRATWVAAGLNLQADFELPLARPFLLITLRLRNDRSQAVRVTHLDPLVTRTAQVAPANTPLTFFSNGWQSWSFAGTLRSDQKQPYTPLGFFKESIVQNPYTLKVNQRGHLTSEMFGVLAAPSVRQAIVAGFLSQREQFGSLTVTLNSSAPTMCLRAQGDDVVLLPNTELVTDAAYVQLLAYDADPLQDYVSAVAQHNAARVPAQTLVGWCSWYHYFDKVTETDIRANLQRLVQDRNRLPLTLFQIDDGFEQNVGDWEANAKFPAGMKALAELISVNKFTAGVWLAPFVVRPDSQLVQQHPEWLIKAGKNFASAGFVFNKFSYGLDTTLPAVQDFTRELITRAVCEWGYPYLKLDFLYAAALKGERHDATKTRAQALALGLKLIREAAGEETFLLGCGCPLGTAVGVVDAMRISADVAPSWGAKVYGVPLPLLDEPATRNAIRNTITRSALHKRWWLNDPDCLLVREATELSLAEVQALASVIALSGGMFLVSDDMTRLSAARREIVEKVLPLDFPAWRLQVPALLTKEMPTELRVDLQGAVGMWQLVGLFNWSERPLRQQLNVQGESHVWDFWNEAYTRVGGGAAYTVELAPHSGRLLGVRAVTAGPQFIASTLHFSQGLEILEWQGTAQGVRFVIKLNRAAVGQIILALPGKPAHATEIAPAVYALPVNPTISQEIKLEW